MRHEQTLILACGFGFEAKRAKDIEHQKFVAILDLNHKFLDYGISFFIKVYFTEFVAI